MGLCDTEIKTIYIDERLSEKDFIETAIHELLHTIDNKSYSAHRGIWKKWANFISQNSDYFINDNYGAETVAIYPPNTVLPQMTRRSRHQHIKNYLEAKQLSLDTLTSFIPYADKSDTRDIIETILLNFPINLEREWQIYLILESTIRKDPILFDKLSCEYCKERFSKTIKTPESRYIFDFIFANTDNYIMVSAHTNEILKRLG